jgi:hemerythrin-like domain-containing protein
MKETILLADYTVDNINELRALIIRMKQDHPNARLEIQKLNQHYDRLVSDTKASLRN